MSLFLLIVALLLPTFAAYTYFELFTSPESVSVLYSASKIIQFSIPLIVLIFISKKTLQWISPKKRDFILGLGFGFVMGFLLLGTFWYLKSFPFIQDVAPLIREKLTDFHADTPMKFLFLAIFISVIHSFLEEYYWRWYVHQELRKYFKIPLATFISSLGFMGHHVIVIKAYVPDSISSWGIFVFPLFVFFAGVFWALIYEKWKSLWIIWFSHFLADVAILWIGYSLVWN